MSEIILSFPFSFFQFPYFLSVLPSFLPSSYPLYFPSFLFISFPPSVFLSCKHSSFLFFLLFSPVFLSFQFLFPPTLPLFPVFVFPSFFQPFLICLFVSHSLLSFSFILLASLSGTYSLSLSLSSFHLTLLVSQVGSKSSTNKQHFTESNLKMLLSKQLRQ